MSALSPLVPDQKFSQLASQDAIDRVVAALQAKKFNVVVAPTGADAAKAVLDLIPEGSAVLTNTSRTLDQLGLNDALNKSDKYVSLRSKGLAMDRATQMKQITELYAAPDVVVQSVHAVTADGTLVIASATGSQFPAVSLGASKVVFVVGTQKLVDNMDQAFERIDKYCYPLEDERARAVYGVPSSINKYLIIRGEPVWTPGRITVVLVQENVGF